MKEFFLIEDISVQQKEIGENICCEEAMKHRIGV